ncbi:Hypothetical predicted protein [Mytilus galloprovincialis]|uniref:Tyr recombinase domain-containing protein n=1 Tax=Mytilus galloprovincialis TaxID=29158 RepID=A0A8B6HSQ9_MYTGA|nr:Hypothetical predicted protein [Mytilus galloprovincialis]
MILKDICQFLRKGYYTPYVDILLEGACVTAYFGFLRCGEFTVLHSFDSECNVSIEDIRFLKDKVTFHLKASKTDPFREGVDIHLFVSGASVCPVLSLERYMDFRARKFKDSKSQDAFFVMENRKALTRNYFISSLKNILAVLGYNSALYNGHSFRIGASTTAENLDGQINLYKEYIAVLDSLPPLEEITKEMALVYFPSPEIDIDRPAMYPFTPEVQPEASPSPLNYGGKKW